MSRPSSSTSARTTTPTAPTPSEESATTSGNYRHSATPSPSTRRPDPVHRGFSDQEAPLQGPAASGRAVGGQRARVSAGADGRQDRQGVARGRDVVHPQHI